MPGASASAAPSAPAAGLDDDLEKAFAADKSQTEAAARALAAPAASARATKLGAGGDADEDEAAPAAPPTLVTSAEVGMPSWHEFAEGWQLGIYRDPVLCGVLAGLVLGVLGVFVVLRRAVFVTAAVSQGAGLGVALAFFIAIRWNIDVPPVLGAFAMALLAAATLALPSERVRLPRDAVLGFAYLAASALAVLCGDRIAQESHNIAAILFGSAVLVREIDLWLVAGIGALVLLVVVLSYRGLVFAGFDPEGARVQRLPVRRLDLLLWGLVALEASVTTRALGSLPVFAFAVLPAMGGLALANRLRTALWVAALTGGAAGGLGYLFAFFFEFPVGASQATVAVIMMLLCVGIAWIGGRGRVPAPT